jgi:UDP-glucose 4-epimerase
MKKILITGAAGFIGSSLANNLYANGHELVLIDSLEYGGDIRRLKNGLRENLVIDKLDNLELLKPHIEGVEIVFHFAGISSLPQNESNPLESIKNNFQSTTIVYEAAIDSGVKQFYFASTSAVYENTQKDIFDESDEVDPDLMYSYSKLLSESYLNKRSAKMDGIVCTVLRFFNVFGSGQNTLRLNPPLTGYLISNLIDDKPVTLYNKSNTKRDYVHVNDIIYAVQVLMEKRPKDIERFLTLNVCSGNVYSVRDIIEILNAIGPRKLNINYKDPQSMWDKHSGVLSKISTNRVVKEVFKQSKGNNLRIREYLGQNYEFVDLKYGLEKMLNDLI